MQINLEIDQLPIAFRIQIKSSAFFTDVKHTDEREKIIEAIRADFIAGTKE
jgi:hypothetical protein